MSKKFQIGVKDLHCGIFDAETNTYSDIEKIEGLKSVNLSVNTNQVPFYSDDTVSQVINSLESVEVEFEVLNLSIDERAKLLGYAKNKGAMAISAKGNTPSVGIAFKSLKSDNKSYRYYAIHNIVFKDPEEELITKEEEVEETTVTMTGIASPIGEDEIVVIIADDDVVDADSTYLSTFLTTIPTTLPKGAVSVSKMSKDKLKEKAELV